MKHVTLRALDVELGPAGDALVRWSDYLGGTRAAVFPAAQIVSVEDAPEPEMPEPPVGSVVLDCDGDAWQRRPDAWYGGYHTPRPWHGLLTFAPLTVLHTGGGSAS